MSTILLVLSLLLAAANGANDVSKGIATLVGSGAATPRRAALWGSAWTFAGAWAAAWASAGLMRTFSGQGVLAVGALSPAMLAAVGLGASGWVVLASRRGWPVSTTHALVGALCGAGIAASGVPGVLWGPMARKVFASLALGPVVSLGLLWLLWPLMSRAARALSARCLCVTPPAAVLASGFAPIAFLDSYTADERRRCGGVAWLVPDLAGAAHWLASGLTSFARGMNDAPKVLGLAAAGAAAVGVGRAFFLVALAMAAGSLWAGGRVTETLARRVTRMEPDEGLAGNVVTAVLVAFASRLGLPVSTTHVAAAAVVGIGLRRDPAGLRWDTVKAMGLAWAVTLPAAGLLAAACYAVLRRFQ